MSEIQRKRTRSRQAFPKRLDHALLKSRDIGSTLKRLAGHRDFNAQQRDIVLHKAVEVADKTKVNKNYLRAASDEILSRRLAAWGREPNHQISARTSRTLIRALRPDTDDSLIESALGKLISCIKDPNWELSSKDLTKMLRTVSFEKKALMALESEMRVDAETKGYPETKRVFKKVAPAIKLMIEQAIEKGTLSPQQIVEFSKTASDFELDTREFVIKLSRYYEAGLPEKGKVPLWRANAAFPLCLLKEANGVKASQKLLQALFSYGRAGKPRRRLRVISLACRWCADKKTKYSSKILIEEVKSFLEESSKIVEQAVPGISSEDAPAGVVRRFSNIAGWLINRTQSFDARPLAEFISALRKKGLQSPSISKLEAAVSSLEAA